MLVLCNIIISYLPITTINIYIITTSVILSPSQDHNIIHIQKYGWVGTTFLKWDRFSYTQDNTNCARIDLLFVRLNKNITNLDRECLQFIDW